MAASEKRTVSLPAEQAAFINQLVASGAYATTSEVVRDGLRALQDRNALEALVLRKFRAGLLTKEELARVLGLHGGDQVDGFLKAHDVFEPYTTDDVHGDVTTLERLGF